MNEPFNRMTESSGTLAEPPKRETELPKKTELLNTRTERPMQHDGRIVPAGGGVAILFLSHLSMFRANLNVKLF